jgi:hypothetical protein
MAVGGMPFPQNWIRMAISFGTHFLDSAMMIGLEGEQQMGAAMSMWRARSTDFRLTTAVALPSLWRSCELLRQQSKRVLTV